MPSAFTPSAANWRLIISSPARGAWNMAVDEAILEAAVAGKAPPTLRLYDWMPPCLSLGYAQPVADVDKERLEALGWDLVRRPTGGRAILHTDELTYAVIGPQWEPRLQGSILESYQRLSGALLAGLSLLGLPAQAQPLPSDNQDGHSKGPVCFEVPSNYEITIHGKKLVGSAQARKREGVLQHGTLPLWGDLTRITQGLCFKDEGEREKVAARLISRATTVEAELGYRVSWDEAAQAFASAFQQALELKLTPGSLSSAELARAEDLITTKYGEREWTERI
jgi:lipoyl(octanoyl) transferase